MFRPNLHIPGSIVSSKVLWLIGPRSGQAWYTALIVTLNLTAQGGGSALAMPGEDVMALPYSQIKAREKGAKIGFVAEQVCLFAEVG